jgi:glycosyltransferase involved in cell wall biosynthesis
VEVRGAEVVGGLRRSVRIATPCPHRQSHYRNMIDAAAAGARAAEDLPPLYLCGPLGDAGEVARGGFQSCNRRTIDALRENGFDVRPLPFPHPRTRGLRKWIEYSLGFLHLFGQVLRCQRHAIVHITALSGSFMYLEWVIVQLARLRGCRVIVDLRAGAVRSQYHGRGPHYRAVFRATLRLADQVMVEGEALVAFVESASGRTPTYLPNHIDVRGIEARSATELLPIAPTVAYIGRLTPEKGLDTVLDACQRLRESGVATRIWIAGDGDASYVQGLRERHGALDAEWLGPLPSAQVLELFHRAHFFVFPTRHVGEGQSNALTEAMACGCVPIASRQGFNEAVIGQAGVTLHVSAGADDYAEQVSAIWRTEGRWRDLSIAAQRRVRESFATELVVRTLVSHYQRLCDRT